MIRPYLRNLISDHKPIMELNINNNTNNNANDNNTNSNRAQWEIKLIMQNNFVSVKDFEDTRTIYLAKVNQ